ncbi:type IV pilus twitching motility protein PilT [Nodularia sphaerocarpa]|uniref:type IV pilus twitching motility protein PilT n=1 Tax=Nodularia sphaerocarpa TaxID=137816 RepID=UPI001EFA7377|nr:type IV pilus twitching motility protein PilT [Nodularia sphaerocarpa]MDB9375727.1 type IV pilus twitching motility protein PilT [Nodularia sphaerocarpa CS-585]MDB9380405.1 type IV pilus twitching motility protein PilT [Nodularia sphaerocarpa CS-585A2]ULP74784.1 Twitching mobility protein [Nodularia sphaerocarpa UHCC 0038]
MTESQVPSNSNTVAPRNVPLVPPPPPPSLQMQRQSTQTLDMSANTSSTQPASYRPGSPPPMPASVTAKTTPRTPTLTLAQLIRQAYDLEYSDLHLGVCEIPRFRNRGEIQITDYPETDKETFMSWLREVLTDAEIQHFQEHLEFDGATQYDFARVRINVFASLRGYAMVLRLIPLKILSMEQLRLPTIFRDICHYHKGLILVTGPTGSGKSTTMAAMIDYINREMAKHIITIEDPIEFVHQSRKSLVKQREVGMHTRKFDNALKAALREDPDLILVGEMRDKETVNTALKAAQTGHLVMGTLHTNSAVKTIERILNLYAGEEQDAMRVAISESLVSVIAQGLCRTTDGKRAAFHDVLINTEAIKEWIKDGKYDDITELMKQASFDGMITMNQSLLNLYQEGRITEETALEMSPTPNEMAQFLRGRV